MTTSYYQSELTGFPWALTIAALILGAIGMPESATAGDRVAFVVGIGTYDNFSADKQLKNPVNDAKGVSEKLTELGFQVIHAPNVTRAEFNSRWQDILNSLTEEDAFVLFFSGHGIQIEGQNYLLPRDIPYIEHGRSEHLKREALSLDLLLSELTTGQRPHPKNSVVIIDACRDNPFVPQNYKGAAPPGGLANVPDPDGMFIIYSAASGRTSLDRLSSTDSEKYSVFTRALLPLMGRKDLEIQILARRLRDEVSQLAKAAGHDQRPAYYDGINGRFCLPGCAGPSTGSDTPKEEHPIVSVRPRVSPTPPRPTTPIFDQFEVQAGEVYSHPQEHSIVFTFDGFELRVITPPASRRARPRFVTELREGEWIPFGGDIPISVMRRGSRILAQWRAWEH